jgi:hypothetical protein
MNCENFTYLLENPSKIDVDHTQQLEEIIHEYPYFQAARAIQLKGLNQTNSFKYNKALKETAACTIDRKMLFEFITSNFFFNTNNSKMDIFEEIEVIDPEFIEVLHKTISKSFEEETNEETNNIEETIIPEVNEQHKASEILELGKPIQFVSAEPHSFNEWMQLISKKPIERNEISAKPAQNQSKNEEKFKLIDKFIESNPKISPTIKNSDFQIFNPEEPTESESLMTETLAKVYLEQHKFDNAIKAYHILSLKYPEKSGFFADRIKAIKILQKNNS